MTITILGLGPGDPADLTQRARDLLSAADEVHLRTARHPTVTTLPSHLSCHSFDELYETLDSFGAVYDAIAEQIVALGRRPKGVLYAVPGHPLVGESSVTRILSAARQEGQQVHIVGGLSFVEPVLSLLGIDGLGGLQLADATEVATAHHPDLDPGRPALIGQIYGLRLASAVKLTLMNAYADDHPVTLVQAAGTEEETTTTIPLYDLDRGQRVDHLTTLYVPPYPGTGGMPALQETVARLRAPGGCPWDQEQTHQTLRSSLLEESYEVLAAIDSESDELLCEELGDLLMQIIMHTQIASEDGSFKLPDIIDQIDAKLRRRHPHVFGDVQVGGTAEVLRNWEAIKAEERAGHGQPHRSSLDGVPVILPALARAQALGDRAARDGFDWPDIEGVLDKVMEELHELRSAVGVEDQSAELGDLLFALVNAARWLGVEAEAALRGACDRFTRRYAYMEKQAGAHDVRLAALSPEELEVLWQEAKSAEPQDSFLTPGRRELPGQHK
jgi:tetrapyrrole methylase family protein/MazG family protein